jgi:hypothetical protein
VPQHWHISVTPAATGRQCRNTGTFLSHLRQPEDSAATQAHSSHTCGNRKTVPQHWHIPVTPAATGRQCRNTGTFLSHLRQPEDSAATLAHSCHICGNRKTVPQHWQNSVTPAATTHAAGLMISTAIPAHCFRSPGYHKYWQNPEYTSSYYRVFPSSPQRTTDVTLIHVTQLHNVATSELCCSPLTDKPFYLCSLPTAKLVISYEQYTYTAFNKRYLAMNLQVLNKQLLLLPCFLATSDR